MTTQIRRLAGISLAAGAVLGTFGYVAAFALVPGGGDAQFTDARWQVFQGIAMAGNLLMVLGLPALLPFRGRAPRAHLVGYVGLALALLMLNLAEGMVTAFVKPYLATHGGIPTTAPTGLHVWEDIALVALVVGLITLGIAVLRAGVLPKWVGIAFIASPVISFVGLPGGWAEIADYLAYAALLAIGVKAARGTTTAASRDGDVTIGTGLGAQPV